MKLQRALGMLLALTVLAEGNSVVLAENISETKHFETQVKTEELKKTKTMPLSQLIVRATPNTKSRAAVSILGGTVECAARFL